MHDCIDVYAVQFGNACAAQLLLIIPTDQKVFDSSHTACVQPYIITCIQAMIFVKLYSCTMY